jgi:hypothetical protein
MNAAQRGLTLMQLSLQQRLPLPQLEGKVPSNMDIKSVKATLEGKTPSM